MIGIFALATVLLLVSAGPAAFSAQPQASDAAAVSEFHRRVQAYADLQARFDRAFPQTGAGDSAVEIERRRLHLQMSLVDARRDAPVGDIFIPGVRSLFVRLLDGVESTPLDEHDEVPHVLPIRINVPYPDDLPLPTMPPDVLAKLPKLSRCLQYRLIGRDLVLHDVDANLIVDAIPAVLRRSP